MRFPCLLIVAASALAQLAEDPQQVVQKLFPDRQRMHRLRLDELAQHLKLRAGSSMADIGCGSGEIALIFSRAVGPDGRVWAEDIDRDVLKKARGLMRKHKARNVTVVEGTAKDPALPPATLDAILLLDVYHELEEYPDMLAKMRAALKPEGRLAIIDPLPRKTGTRDREVQMTNHVLAPEIAERDLRGNGFRIVIREDRFLDHPDDEGVQWLIVAAPSQ
jgi:ubiquinone/menaquinone biosynthesis C-methylase UbiE